MNRETQNVLLLLVGGAVFKIVFDNSYLRYVQPGMRPLLLAGAALTVLLAIAAIVRDIRQPSAADNAGQAQTVPGGAHADADHTHEEHGRGGVYWALLIPAAVMLFVVPPALGADSVGVSSKQPQVSQARDQYPDLPAGDAPELALVEFVQRASSGKTVDKRTVTLTAYAVERDLGPGWDLARMIIACCAADAGSVRVHLENPPSGVTRGQWYAAQVQVIPGTATEETGYTPTVRVVSAKPIPEPAVAYER